VTHAQLLTHDLSTDPFSVLTPAFIRNLTVNSMSAYCLGPANICEQQGVLDAGDAAGLAQREDSDHSWSEVHFHAA